MTAVDRHKGAGGPANGPPFRLGVFTRLVDEVAPAEVYARALHLFERADELGLDTGWVAQHHAHKQGGMPSPLIFLTAAAARTRRLRLATAIITLPLESPLRLAEDAAVLDILCGGRLELGFGTGGDEDVFAAFGRQVERRQDDYDRAFAVVHDALSGRGLGEHGPEMFPPGSARLTTSFWEATFGVEGAMRAAEHGSGLLLARTAARTAAGGNAVETQRSPDNAGAADTPRSLGDVQAPLVEAYLEHWHSAGPPRVGLSRSLYVAPTRAEALADAEAGLRRYAALMRHRTGIDHDLPLEELLAKTDIHLGSPDDVIASLRADRLLPAATDLILQVHPIDPSPEKTLRSLRLLADEVAPALGWRAG